MSIDISKIQFPDQMNIRETALFLELGEQRVRALHRSGTLAASDKDGRLMFAKKDLEAYKSTPRTRNTGQRAGGKAFVIRVVGDKLPAVQKFLETQGIKLEQRYDYEKMKVYQAKSKARKAAQKATSTPVTTSTPIPATPTKSGVAGVLQKKS